MDGWIGGPHPRAHTRQHRYKCTHKTRQFYLFPNLLLCSFGIDAASETHMLRCPQDFDAFRFRKTSHLVRCVRIVGWAYVVTPPLTHVHYIRTHTYMT